MSINMDNCGATNKNRYIIAFLAELVRIGRFDEVYLTFMVVGHTKVILFFLQPQQEIKIDKFDKLDFDILISFHKFQVDLLFSMMAHSFNRSDVFNVE